MGWFNKKSLVSLAQPLPLHELKKRTKIVVIDDDENAFPMKALQDEGYTIEWWPEVQSLERLERGDFDIIVLDIAGVAQKFSPDEDGFGILQHLKQRNPIQIIVAFSGQSFDFSKRDFFKLADDMMPKPVNALKCKQVLDELIESKMTVKHLWGTLVVLMKAEGVPEKKIAELEGRVAKAVSSGTKADIGKIVSDTIKRGELAAKAVSVVTKIMALFG